MASKASPANDEVALPIKEPDNNESTDDDMPPLIHGRPLAHSANDGAIDVRMPPVGDGEALARPAPQSKVYMNAPAISLPTTPSAPLADDAVETILRPVWQKIACKAVDDEMENDCLVHELRNLDDQYLILEAQCQVEEMIIHRKYLQRYAPLLEKRRQRLARPGEDASVPHTTILPNATPAIPGFWRAVLQNSAIFQEYIEEYDEPVLDYLKDVAHEPLDDLGVAGFRILFSFDKNPFFSNNVLEKVFHTERKSAFASILSCAKIKSPKIEWLPGKNVTVEVITKKAKGGGRKKTSKSKREEVPRPSFFRAFFRSLGPDEEIPEEELEDHDEDEDCPVDLMEMLLADDYEQGVYLRDSLLPHAIRWYTGEACDEEEDEIEDDYGEDELDEEFAVIYYGGDGKGSGKSGKHKPAARGDGTVAVNTSIQETKSDCTEQ